MNPEPRPYLAGLDLAGRRVVVVGGGTVAQRRLPALLAAGADVEVVAPVVTPAVEGMATAKELRWTPRAYREGDLADTWYALAATDDPAVNAEIAAAAQRARALNCLVVRCGGGPMACSCRIARRLPCRRAVSRVKA